MLFVYVTFIQTKSNTGKDSDSNSNKIFPLKGQVFTWIGCGFHFGDYVLA